MGGVCDRMGGGLRSENVLMDDPKALSAGSGRLREAWGVEVFGALGSPWGALGRPWGVEHWGGLGSTGEHWGALGRNDTWSWVLTPEHLGTTHPSMRFIQRQLATPNSGQYLTLDFHQVFPSPLPPPFNVNLACVQYHVKLKHKTSRRQH